MARFLRLALVCLFAVAMVSIAAAPVLARYSDHPRPHNAGPVTTAPNYMVAAHNVGKMVLTVVNNGTFGDGFSPTCDPDQCADSFTGLPIESCEYPKGSRTKYLFAGAFWIGAVVGNDTLVTTGADGWQTVTEFNPEEGDLGRMLYRSTIDPSSPAFEGAVSEQDYIAVYYDTCVNCPGSGSDFIDNRPHRPLNIEVSQRSYAWSYSYAEDIVLFDYSIRNIGTRSLKDVYMGVYVDADIHQIGVQDGAQDDLCGFRRKQPALYLPPTCEPDSDIVNIAWTADNDGDLNSNYIKVPNVTATRIVRTPSDSLRVSFNWWISNGDAALDYGPQHKPGVGLGPRDLGTGGQGTPEGDRNKYFYLRNGEFDYDQAYVATINPTDPVWTYPPQNQARTWARGLDTRYLLSFGPFQIEPGQTLPLSFAYVAGEDFHSDPDNLDNLPDNPDAYYANLSFDSLGQNATWADWIYDNPGVDTDSDGYFGEYRVCATSSDSTQVFDTTVDSSVIPFDTTVDTFWEYATADTVWYKGDGVPDFRGASPPPAPATYTSPLTGKRGLRVEPVIGGARVVWQGVASENTVDVFSREKDFEGYRVYQARDNRPSSYSLLASYDREDYNKYEYVTDINGFKLLHSPYTLQELQTLYGNGDTTWNPLDYTRNHPYINPDSTAEILYFEPQDYNRSILANYPNSNTPIAKVYPNAERPPDSITGLLISNPDSIFLFPDSIYNLYFTKDGFLKYYEYEYTIEGQLPSVPYWINVTAFDYGSPRSGLQSLETQPSILPANTYYLESVQQVQSKNLKVFVYPNPYREDANYRSRGFEGRGEIDKGRDHVRQINFANLPPKCTISIFTLDGDLVREIHHEYSENDPLANHDSWNLITRNTQLAVSGLYYWTVEDDKGNVQIGKLVIIL